MAVPTLAALFSLSRLPSWSALAIALICASIFLLNSNALTNHQSPKITTSAVVTSPSLGPNSTFPLPAIAALNLFGKVTAELVVDPSTLPTTKLNWKLVGVIGSSLTGESRGLIAIDNKPTKAYFKGDSLADGAVIYDINSDYVIVRRGEQMEKLPLHAGDPVVYTATRHSTAKDTVVETTPQLQPATSSTPVTAQTVYKGLEDRLAMIRQNKSS